MDLDLQSCARLLQTITSNVVIKQGKQLHLLFLKRGVLPSSITLANRLLQMYARCGDLIDAWKLFDEMPQRNCFTWNSIIEGYVKSRNKEESLHLFYAMPHKNSFTWNMIISGFVKASFIFSFGMVIPMVVIKRANILGLFVVVDISFGSWEVQLYAKAIVIGLESDKVVSTALDEASWNSMLMGYATNGYGIEALHLFSDMRKVGKRRKSRKKEEEERRGKKEEGSNKLLLGKGSSRDRSYCLLVHQSGKAGSFGLRVAAVSNGNKTALTCCLASAYQAETKAPLACCFRVKPKENTAAVAAVCRVQPKENATAVAAVCRVKPNENTAAIAAVCRVQPKENAAAVVAVCPVKPRENTAAVAAVCRLQSKGNAAAVAAV
ncbi:Pentatricopeptide repeat-containing protein [Cynara cardunculus var. scolymus]|uniref:Pentatricopeptide repeat-containing protein n=1 Tax=Cynara cardunculus var. scolymus TaxID=59895 RepID=A0A103XTQ5_CYNCS|nr:Pentatricopeptide repeat-containing protein [Cynara cardunculus var. scolymus]